MCNHLLFSTLSSIMKKILSLLSLLFLASSLTGAPKKDIVDTAIEAGNFSTLVAAVQKADLVETLKGDGPFTVFRSHRRGIQKVFGPRP